MSWMSVRNEIDALMKVLVEESAKLPELPITGCPDHGESSLTILETGYSRSSDLHYADDHWWAFSEGWDDMSDSGAGGEIATCLDCEGMWCVPDNLEWV